MNAIHEQHMVNLGSMTLRSVQGLQSARVQCAHAGFGKHGKQSTTPSSLHNLTSVATNSYSTQGMSLMHA